MFSDVGTSRTQCSLACLRCRRHTRTHARMQAQHRVHSQRSLEVAEPSMERGSGMVGAEEGRERVRWGQSVSERRRKVLETDGRNTAHGSISPSKCWFHHLQPFRGDREFMVDYSTWLAMDTGLSLRRSSGPSTAGCLWGSRPAAPATPQCHWDLDNIKDTVWSLGGAWR